MYAVTSMPLVSRTRATLRRAELGFLGVEVKTRTQTPRFWGDPWSAGLSVLDLSFSRPTRTSWLTVGNSPPEAQTPLPGRPHSLQPCESTRERGGLSRAEIRAFWAGSVGGRPYRLERLLLEGLGRVAEDPGRGEGAAVPVHAHDQVDDAVGQALGGHPAVGLRRARRVVGVRVVEAHDLQARGAGLPLQAQQVLRRALVSHAGRGPLLVVHGHRVGDDDAVGVGAAQQHPADLERVPGPGPGPDGIQVACVDLQRPPAARGYRWSMPSAFMTASIASMSMGSQSETTSAPVSVITTRSSRRM